MNSTLNDLKKKRLVWSASEQPIDSMIDSEQALNGYPELDDMLANSFPSQGVISIDTSIGIGELRLLLPYLQQQKKQQNERLLVFIAPPAVINAELLAEQGFALAQVLVIQAENKQQTLWAAEQCLKSGCCHTVLMWQSHLQIHQVKRLQLAADVGNSLQIIVRPSNSRQATLPVSLAMQLTPQAQGITVTISKRKGGWPRSPFHVNMQQCWPRLTIRKQTAVLAPTQPCQAS